MPSSVSRPWLRMLGPPYVHVNLYVTSRIPIYASTHLAWVLGQILGRLIFPYATMSFSQGILRKERPQRGIKGSDSSQPPDSPMCDTGVSWC